MELADEWWEASARYREERHWHKAATRLTEGDQRVLVLAPGEQHELHPITEALHSFLTRAGFAPRQLDPELDPAAHREDVASFPRVLALPVSVGATCEVIDFLNKTSVDQKIAVILPKNYRDGYFARLVEHDTHIRIKTCGEIRTSPGEVDKDVGRAVLQALAGLLNADAGTALARQRTAQIPQPANVQAREAADDTQRADIVRVPAASPLVAFGVTIAIFLVAAVVIGLLFAMLPLGAAIPCTAIIAVTFVLLAVTVLRQLGQIGEQTFARLIDSGLNRLPGRVGAPTQDGAVEPASTEESP